MRPTLALIDVSLRHHRKTTPLLYRKLELREILPEAQGHVPATQIRIEALFIADGVIEGLPQLLVELLTFSPTPELYIVDAHIPHLAHVVVSGKVVNLVVDQEGLRVESLDKMTHDVGEHVAFGLVTAT